MEVLATDGDNRTPEAVRFDAISEQVREAVLAVRELAEMQRSNHGTVQTVIHKTEGMGAWGSAAVTACFFTFLGLILFAIWVVPNINSLQAWSDIYRQRIQNLEKK